MGGGRRGRGRGGVGGCVLAGATTKELMRPIGHSAVLERRGATERGGGGGGGAGGGGGTQPTARPGDRGRDEPGRAELPTGVDEERGGREGRGEGGRGGRAERSSEQTLQLDRHLPVPADGNEVHTVARSAISQRHDLLARDGHSGIRIGGDTLDQRIGDLDVRHARPQPGRHPSTRQHHDAGVDRLVRRVLPRQRANSSTEKPTCRKTKSASRFHDASRRRLPDATPIPNGSTPAYSAVRSPPEPPRSSSAP